MYFINIDAIIPIIDVANAIFIPLNNNGTLDVISLGLNFHRPIDIPTNVPSIPMLEAMFPSVDSFEYCFPFIKKYNMYSTKSENIIVTIISKYIPPYFLLANNIYMILF
jgi:hypothetical protein